MKRLSLIAMAALALVLTFTQCKKEVAEQPEAKNRVFITVKGNLELNDEEQNDERMTINNLGLVWSEGCTEYVYVGGSRHEGCIGVLSGQGNGTTSISFEGYIDDPIDGEVLYYFYLGKGDERTDDDLNILDFSYQSGDPTEEDGGLDKYIVAIAAAIYYQGIAYYVLPFSLQTAFARFDRQDLYNWYEVSFAWGGGYEVFYPFYLYGDDIWTTATVDYQNGRIVGRTKGAIMCSEMFNRTPTLALIPSTTNVTTVKFWWCKKFGDLTFYNGIQPGKFYMHDDASALEIEGHEITDMPLTFEAKTATAQVGFFSTYSKELDLEYKINDGEWETYSYPRIVPLNLGDKVSFRGDNETFAGYVPDGHGSQYLQNSFFVCASGECYLYGNVMSLLYKEDFATANILPKEKEYTFYSLFKPLEREYEGFYNHPTLPLMLPALELKEYCYAHMFEGCTHLTIAPELPAWYVSEKCYEYMFNGCTSLTVAPTLAADEVKLGCYAGMFKDCSSLDLVRCLAKDLPFVPGGGSLGYDFDNVFQNMLDGVAPTGTFFMNKDTHATWDGIVPEGWNKKAIDGLIDL